AQLALPELDRAAHPAHQHGDDAPERTQVLDLGLEVREARLLLADHLVLLQDDVAHGRHHRGRDGAEQVRDPPAEPPLEPAGLAPVARVHLDQRHPSKLHVAGFITPPHWQHSRGPVRISPVVRNTSPGSTVSPGLSRRANRSPTLPQPEPAEPSPTW